MTRGNQRDKAREKNIKAQGNLMSGNEFARNKEDVAAIMRAKQAAAEAKKAGAETSSGGNSSGSSGGKK